MDNNTRVYELRNKYNEFRYKSYSISEDEDNIYLRYNFEITNLCEFNPSITINKKHYIKENINTNIFKNLVFNLGLVELISYWKSTFSKNVIIECGHLNEEQINFFKKLYFNGLGELRYRNNIKIDYEDFMNITTAKEQIDLEKDNTEYSDYIFPIGGGKDSNVTIELLNKSNNNLCFIVNPKQTTLECAHISGFDSEHIIEVKRTIDNNLLELNKQGFINGHTPFSAMISFLSTLMGYLTHKKYIALSNEYSANESNIDGENINHQYSKSLEYENDFRDYSSKYLYTNTEYFSFLRPISEYQIAYLFSHFDKYHKVFKSCNVGLKTEPWQWCKNCAKCLFVYIILSPFLYKDKLIDIFDEDLFENKELLDLFIDLTGHGNLKPFDCVGTFYENRYAVSKTIQNLNDKNLPYLLKYYKDNYPLEDTTNDILKEWHNDNNLNDEQMNILKEWFK